MLSAFWAVALVISSLWASVIGLRMPVPEIRMLKKKDLEIEDSSAKNSLLEKKDLVCLEDDYLLSLQMFPDDSIPSCSSYLGIQDVISTAFVKARTFVPIAPSRKSNPDLFQNRDSTRDGRADIWRRYNNPLWDYNNNHHSQR